MSLRRTRARRRPSITSLIDVIFLLLLFFMLASTFSKFSELELAGVAAPGQASAGEVETMVLTVDQQRLVLDGTEVLEGDLVQRVSADMDRVSQLTLQVTEAASTQRLTDILLILKPLDGLHVSMVGAG